MSEKEELNVLDLPEEIIETVVSYLTYHEASESRAICKLFNKYCQMRLNKGFAKVDKLHALIQKEVKNKLPRRESERRNHPLARHVDILSAIETRLSLLGMSYMKFIDTGLCCFIPGKVLDELVSILKTLQSSDQPPRSHEFLQELRDISSMAMEHFDEKIAPGLKCRLPAVSLPYPFSESCACPIDPQAGSTLSLFSSGSSPIFSPSTSIRGPSIRAEVNTLGTQLRVQSSNVRQIRKEVSDSKVNYTNQRKKLLSQEKKIVQQGQIIQELEKKVNDLNQKFIDLSAELMKIKGAEEGDGTKTLAFHKLTEECSAAGQSNMTEAYDREDRKESRNKALKRKQGVASVSHVKRSKR